MSAEKPIVSVGTPESGELRLVSVDWLDFDPTAWDDAPICRRCNGVAGRHRSWCTEDLDDLWDYDEPSVLASTAEGGDYGASADWLPVDLAALWDSEPIEADVGWREDGVAMFYRGCVNLVFGESASGKSWIALLAVAAVLGRGKHAVYFDAEDTGRGVAQRLKVLGVTRDQLSRLTYVNPSTYTRIGRDQHTVAVMAADLVVFDATTEFLSAMGGLSSNSDTDVADFMSSLPKWAARLGPAVVVIDHTPKDGSNRNGPQGSQHKRAAVDGAAYYVEPVAIFKRSGEGLSLVWLNKDKQGGVGQHANGDFFAELRADGGFRLTVGTPPVKTLDPEARRAARQERLMAEIVAAAEREGKPLQSVNGVRKSLKAAGIHFTTSHVNGALLAELVDRGFLTDDYGFVKPYEGTGLSGQAAEDDGDAY
jgi:AAA domain